MTLFYFKTTDSESALDDDQGQDLRDLICAVEEAKRILAEMAADGIPRNSGERLVVEVVRSDRISVVRLALTLDISYPSMENNLTA